MSVLAELLRELSDLLSAVPEKQKPCQCSSSEVSALVPSTVILRRSAHFSTPQGSELVELSAGEYQVNVLPNGHLLLTSSTENRYWLITGRRTWHPFNLTSLLVLNVHTDGVQNIMALFPGGGAWLAMGSQGQSLAGAPGPTSIENGPVVEAILDWKPLQWPARRVPFNERLLLPPFLVGWGQIAPDPSPASFAPMKTPPNWVSATVATSSPGDPFIVGDSVRRGPFGGYVTSVTSVSVSLVVPTMKPGWLVQLLVTSRVNDIGGAPMIDVTWTDLYQIVSPGSGPVVFPGVILATGRAASNAPQNTWVPDAGKAFTTTSPESGIPVQFELRINGVTFATKTCLFDAQYDPPTIDGSPVLTCL